jgi:hypothetical protein
MVMQITEIQSAGMRLMSLLEFCFHFRVAASAYGVEPRSLMSSIEQASDSGHRATKSSCASVLIDDELKNMRIHPTSATDSEF